ncbi:MAG: hypothetical protein IJB74_02600 [Clostridia bacterium]|nr:hypothetical protein [Clostridia bacterium]
MRKNKNIKAVASIIITVILIFSVLVPAGVILQDKFSTNKFLDRQNIQEFYSLEKNTIDLLCIGSSQIMNGFVAGEIYGNYGITSYGLGTCSQPVYAAYHWLLEAEKYQSPKMILYEVSRLYGDNSPMNYVKAFTEMKNTSPIKLKALSRLELTAEEFASYYSDVYAFHSRFSELSKDDFTYLLGGNKQTYLGAALSERLFDEYSLDEEDFSFDKGSYAADFKDEENLIYFEKMVSYCKEKDIKLVLFKTTKEDWTAAHHTGVKELAEKHGLDFVDLNLEEAVTEMELDFNNDFIDPEHYNYYGAVKATNYIGKFIDKNYDLPDRREGSGYIESYGEKFKDYLHAVKNIKLSNSNNLDDILKYIDDDKYTIVIAKRGPSDLTEKQIELFTDMGFTAVSKDYINSVFVKSNGKIYENGASPKKIHIYGTADKAFFYAVASGGQVTAKAENAAIKIDDADGIAIAVYDNASQRIVLEYTQKTKE